MAGLKVHTAETTWVVDTDDLKNHLKITGTDDNDTLDIIRVAIHNWAKEYLNRTLTTVTYQLFIDAIYAVDIPIKEGSYVGIDENINRRSIELPMSPVSSVTHIKYYDDEDSASTWASSNYYVDTTSIPARIVLRNGSSFPSGATRVANALEIQYVAGYGAMSTVPVPIKLGCLNYASYLFEHRGDLLDGKTVIAPYSATQLLEPYRVKNLSTHPYQGMANYGGMFG